MKELTHGSLFTGVGMIDYGLQAAGFRTLWQVERDCYCLDVLPLRWPGVRKLTEIKDCGRHNLEPVDLISGGFPCAQISVAGNMEGIGTRDEPTLGSGLWYEMFRVVRELRPRWVLIENLARLLRTEDGDSILGNLEGEGYACWPHVLGAGDYGAPHARKRTWVLCRYTRVPLFPGDNHAHRDCNSGEGMESEKLHLAAERALAEGDEKCRYWKHELGSGNDGADGCAAESQAAAYRRGVRAVHEDSHWVDRLRCCGNSVDFLVPFVIGSVVARIEREFGAERPERGSSGIQGGQHG